jgi:hypothetical protein
MLASLLVSAASAGATAADLAGCSVPDVAFVGNDAASAADAAQVPRDGTTTGDELPELGDGQTGADAVGAPADAGAPGDAVTTDGAGGGCPDALPSGAAVCCDSVPCKGTVHACTSACVNCSNDCAGLACCLDKNGNFQGCAATAETCP